MTDSAPLTALTSPENERAAQACRATAEAAQAAIDWMEANAERVGPDGTALLSDLRKAANAARKMEVAVRRPMCVGVFGPSQAGKSYLISALARKDTESLNAKFAGRTVDFVEEINPQGGQESTGLVTRFTLQPGRKTPDGFPVELRLLSQTDIVKIIGNTFYLDGDPNTFPAPDPAAVHERLSELARAAQAEAVDTLTSDDVFDLQEYFDKQFPTAPRLRALGPNYWTQAARLAPRLKRAERAQLFALLWADVEPLTELYKRLHAALAELDFAPEAFAPLNALVPRETSIIDVRTLYDLGKDAGERLDLVNPAGKKVSLPRAEVTAIVAELRIVVEDKPWDFFDHTDLLDFPGARSREIIPNMAEELARKGDMLQHLFLRGKVAYLFDRYVAERELTAMLLCIGPSNQEVKTLPDMINQWISVTHGDTPQARARRTTALFLVLTKFDTEFERAKGKREDDDSPTERWTARLQASLVDFFGKRHGWVHEWDGRRGFRNTFWMRNPNIAATDLLDYDEEKLRHNVFHELGIRAGERERIGTFRTAYLNNELVKRHFAEPEAAWDAAFALNDGGIRYLAEKLRPVCNPDLKRQQIEGDLAEWRRRLAERLTPFYISTDAEKEREKKRKLAQAIAQRLVGSATSQRFGELLRALQVDDEDLESVYYRVEGLESGSNGHSVTVGRAADAGAMLSALGLGGSGDANGESMTDQADRFARASVELWVEKLNKLADDEAAGTYYRVPRGDMSNLIHELVTGATRLGLRRDIAGDVRDQSKYRNVKWDQMMDRVVLLAANHINTFVDYLGFEGQEEALRPAVSARDGASRPVFRGRPPVDGFPQLSETPSQFDQDYYVDWIAAFMKLVEDNFAMQGEEAIDVEQNSRLGAILERLDALAA
ncbi:MAG: virulence factor SrfC family protein [Alphaproteobacteria bacterium]